MTNISCKNSIQKPRCDTPEKVVKRSLYKLFVWIFCITLVVLVCFDWIELYYQIQIIAKPVTRAFLFILFIIVIIIPFKYQKKRFFLSLPLIALGYMFFTYAILEDDVLSGLYYSSKIIFWIVGTFFVYKLLLSGHLKRNHINFSVYSIALIYSIMVFFFMFNPSMELSQNIGIYSLLWCVPIMMLANNTTFKKLIIVLTFIVILISFKRGAMLALILSTLSYLTTYFWINRSFNTFFKAFSLILSVIIIFVFSLSIVHEFRPEFFERRVSDIVDKEKAIGSGRGDFYPFLFDKYITSLHSSPVNFFLGFGSRSVEKNLSGGNYAHSDWLQLLYGYGFIGIILLTWIHLRLVRLIWVGIKQKFKYVPALAMNYTIFFLLNIYSGMIFFPSSIFFGMFISIYYYLWLNRHSA